MASNVQSGSPGSTTSVSLLELLRGDSPDKLAWDAFFRLYQPRIQSWCRRWGAQDADAEDVTQIVLTKLAARLRSFQYDPSRSFRAFVKTMTHNVWNDLIQMQSRSAAPGDSGIARLLEQVEAKEDLERRLAADFDQELLDKAFLCVRERVAEHTWEAFRLTALEGLSGAEAAKQLQIPVAHVFVAKQRVLRMLQDVVRENQQS